MNAVEIEEAVSELVSQPFDAEEFPFQFLKAFGAKETTIKRLRKGDSNSSDVTGGVLQRNNIHVAVAPEGRVSETLAALRASPKTATAKAKFLLATDGATVEAEDLVADEAPIACAYIDLPRHFGFFLPLAGISTVKEIKNNPIDVKATGRLNRLYVELLKDNPDWATEEKRAQLNQFMAQLIFCFFAEDTDIFQGSYKFTPTVERMTSGQSDNTQAVIAELFRAMGTPPKDRAAARLPTWADGFPYVNGGYLFSGDTECPQFSRTARAYLLRAGELDWKEINPDIFGSMIQAVADEGERGELGMHYTSVPNILKVLNPLFLDDLREQLEAAGDSRQKLRNLRKRLASIRVFDPACGSGNFLVIAYKQMREVEAAVIDRLGGEANLKLEERRSVIPLSNFYGIEIKGFAAEIARLALLIAEFQADCLYLSQQEARAMVLPLHRTGEIRIGNALRIAWEDVCPTEDIDTERTEQPETYICGNPPYKGSQDQDVEQKADLAAAFADGKAASASADYVSGWFIKARQLTLKGNCTAAFVTTNSIHQGRQVASLWNHLFADGVEIAFARPSFKWSNLASNQAVVTVSVIGLRKAGTREKYLFESESKRSVEFIGPYLLPGNRTVVEPSSAPLSNVPPMNYGSMPNDGGHLLLSQEDANALKEDKNAAPFIRRFWGAGEIIAGVARYCIWVEKDEVGQAQASDLLARRFSLVEQTRKATSRKATNALADFPWRFGEVRQSSKDELLVIPIHTSENRQVLPMQILRCGEVVSNACYQIANAPNWVLAILSSRCHLSWIAAVCGKLETRYRYSNTLGWNTFPVPKLTEQEKGDLTRAAENILLAREAHFPATIGDLYEPEAMPDDLRRAHEENDEVLERIYIGRRFRNDTERLEKLFELYTKMAADKPKARKGKKAA